MLAEGLQSSASLTAPFAQGRLWVPISAWGRNLFCLDLILFGYYILVFKYSIVKDDVFQIRIAVRVRWIF